MTSPYRQFWLSPGLTDKNHRRFILNHHQLDHWWPGLVLTYGTFARTLDRTSFVIVYVYMSRVFEFKKFWIQKGVSWKYYGLGKCYKTRSEKNASISFYFFNIFCNIIPALSLILWPHYYAQNYAVIIWTTLVVCHFTNTFNSETWKERGTRRHMPEFSVFQTHVILDTTGLDASMEFWIYSLRSSDQDFTKKNL